MTQLTGLARLRSWLKTGLVYLLIFMLAGFLGNLWMTRDQTSGPVPALMAQDLDGQWQPLLAEQRNSPVMLYFFAEWCPICKAQHGAISAINEHYPVIAIAMQSGDNQQVRQYVEQQGLELRIVNDADGRLSRAFGVHGVPAAFIIDQQGIIRFSTRGYATRIGLLARLWLTDSGWI